MVHLGENDSNFKSNYNDYGILYTLYGHGKSYRVACAPYPMNTSNERDLALLLLADMCLVFDSHHSLDPIGGASVEPFL